MGNTQSSDAPTTIDIPSQSRLRYMALALKRDQLESLEIYKPLPSTTPFCNELIHQFRLAKGVTRDRVWTMAMRDEFHRPPYQCNVNDVFRYFLRLPFEIQENIWTQALEGDRLLEIVWSDRGKWSTAQSSRFGYPSLMRTCYQSREVAKKRIFFCFGTWINTDSDLIWINGTGVNLWAKSLLFASTLFEACLAVTETENDSQVTAGYKLKRIAISSEFGEELLRRERRQKNNQHPGMPLFGGNKGALRTLLPWVNNVVLIAEEHVHDRPGVSYRDERLLTQDDLLDLSFVEDSSAAYHLQKRIRASMAKEGESSEVSTKLLVKCSTARRL